LMRSLMAAPSIMLFGELATAAFLYFVIYAGARPPWRDVRSAVLASAARGHQVDLIARSGCDVMRVYLRPSHWRGTGASVAVGSQSVARDPHPGVRVSAIPADLAAARTLLSSPDAVLVLQRDEWMTLLSAELIADLLEDFVVAEVWPSPQPHGSQALYLLRRRCSH